MPYTFYLKRLSEEPFEKEPQSLAAGMGSAFDVFVKTMIARKMDKIDVLFKRILDEQRDDDLRMALSRMPFTGAFYQVSVEEHNREQVKAAALVLASQYYNSPLCKNTNWVDFEKHINCIILPENIPLYMKLDAIINLDTLAPLDWKIKGFGGDGVSPPQGYIVGYNADGSIIDSHKNYTTTIAMDEIDAQWAAQLCTYGWGMGKEIGVPFQAVIDCGCFRSDAWRFFRYVGWITEEFQRSLVLRYRDCWNKINNGSFYNSLCKDPLIQNWMAKNERWY